MLNKPLLGRPSEERHTEKSRETADTEIKIINERMEKNGRDSAIR
jgi:hypothetical protein